MTKPISTHDLIELDKSYRRAFHEAIEVHYMRAASLASLESSESKVLHEHLCLEFEQFEKLFLYQLAKTQQASSNPGEHKEVLRKLELFDALLDRALSGSEARRIWATHRSKVNLIVGRWPKT